MTTQHTLYEAAKDADANFQAAVIRQFGARRAGDMRYRTDLHNAETLAEGDRFRAACAEMRGEK